MHSNNRKSDMFGFGKEKMAMPQQQEAERGLTATSPEVLEKLEELASQAAEELGITDQDLIAEAAYFVALAAEDRGEPYTMGMLEGNEELPALLKRAVEARQEVGDLGGEMVMGPDGVQVGYAKDAQEAARIAGETREGMGTDYRL